MKTKLLFFIAFLVVITCSALSSHAENQNSDWDFDSAFYLGHGRYVCFERGHSKEEAVIKVIEQFAHTMKALVSSLKESYDDSTRGYTNN
ncbi:hypothetical protein LLG96_02445, partial [bacterium]|nr:hypothetical protein [bacterium]